jgi:hypothetical protein
MHVQYAQRRFCKTLVTPRMRFTGDKKFSQILPAWPPGQKIFTTADIKVAETVSPAERSVKLRRNVAVKHRSTPWKPFFKILKINYYIWTSVYVHTVTWTVHITICKICLFVSFFVVIKVHVQMQCISCSSSCYCVG